MTYSMPLFCSYLPSPGSGVFSRKWTKAHVTMDCGSYIPNITMLEL